ncbi:MAG: hypothetical protein GXY33_06590 [Phycisphaerae bacterium]|nr:hypothetical protein [Phycisphaerae bacterium]
MRDGSSGDRRVKTTTWPQRHEGTFAALGEHLRRLGVAGPRVLEVGPGATSRWLASRLAPGEGERLSAAGNRWRAFLRNLDSLVRRLPGAELQSYEPGELWSVLPEGSSLIVTDISRRVVEAVGRQYPHVEARVLDLSREALSPPADAVVCLCVLVRAESPRPIFENLCRSLRTGGLLAIDQRSVRQFAPSDFPFEQLGPQIWRKNA